MRDFLVVETSPEAGEAPWRAAEARIIAGGGWTKVAERRWFSVFLEAAAPPAYRHLPGIGGALIGDVFDSDDARQGRGGDLDLLGFGGDVEVVAARLSARAFGRYVAILNDDRGPVRVLRDPLGAMDAIGWRRGPLRFVASRLPPLADLWPPELSIDQDALAAILRQKNLASLICPLRGLVSYPPGVLAGPDGRGLTVWSPARIAAAGPAIADPERLRLVVDGVIAAWAQRRQGVFCEISGGLDSAIVATSLAAIGAPLRYGLNQTYPQKEGDERPYAQAVADRIGAPLVVIGHELTEMDPERLAANATGVRPSWLGGDPAHDADLAARLSAPGIDAMFTGRGGDGSFFQPASPALVGDILAGACGPRLAALEVLARRNSTTVWSILRRGLSRRKLTAGAGAQMFMADGVADGPAPVHPWLREAEALPAARQLQILMTVNGLGAFGESQARQAGDVIDPLLSQPVLEYCLAVPAGRLAVGPLNRPFARQAFAARLPPEILLRPGKGEVTNYVARRVGRSLPQLRAFLLEGWLAQAGLLDLDRLDQALSRDELVVANILAPIFVLLAAEAWARNWSGAQAAPGP